MNPVEGQELGSRTCPLGRRALDWPSMDPSRRPRRWTAGQAELAGTQQASGWGPGEQGSSTLTPSAWGLDTALPGCWALEGSEFLKSLPHLSGADRTPGSSCPGPDAQHPAHRPLPTPTPGPLRVMAFLPHGPGPGS